MQLSCTTPQHRKIPIFKTALSTLGYRSDMIKISSDGSRRAVLTFLRPRPSKEPAPDSVKFWLMETDSKDKFEENIFIMDFNDLGMK